jgi:hypothetical protein
MVTSTSWTVWSEKDARTPYMNYCHKVTLIVPKIQDQKLLTFFWHSVSEWGRECVAHTFPPEGSQSHINGCLQQIASMISLDANSTTIHTRLTLIFSMGNPLYCIICYISRLQICWLWMTASAKNISARAEWLCLSGRAPSEPSETYQLRITLRPVSIQRVAFHIALWSLFHRFVSFCRSPIVND